MIAKYWEEYCNTCGYEGKYKSAICFGTSAQEAQLALEAVLNGRKTAAIYPETGYRTSMYGSACAGDRNLIVDWKGTAHAVIETVNVCRIALCELTDKICRADGCSDAEAWREARLPALKLEIEELGGELTEQSCFVVENFRCIYPA